jgi:AraC-like DNA-binding protein
VQCTPQQHRPLSKDWRGAPATRLLAGRLKVRWPGGPRLRSIPSVLTVRAKDIINFRWLLDWASGSGAMAILTRAATLLFVSAFREHPQSRAAFLEFDHHDPVLLARQCMEIHPFARWTVEILAGKVGMGRSSFATRFARKVGRTPMDFLTEEHMKHATLFLEKTDMKVMEIAARRADSAPSSRSTSGPSPGWAWLGSSTSIMSKYWKPPRLP